MKVVPLLEISLSLIVFLLSIIAYFLKQHLDNFRHLENKVDGHEIRITVLETHKQTKNEKFL